MHRYERALLMAWSNQLAGAGPRLARRAWAILEDHKRTKPGDLSSAWGDASDLHQWVMSYRRFGPAGLLDAPRPGRPKSAGLEAEELIRTLNDRTSSSALPPEWQAANRSIKEAAWRQMRSVGSERVTRRGRHLDVPLPIHPGLRDLTAVFADGQGLIAIATFDHLDDYIESLQGTWVGVPSSVRGKSKGIRYSLTEALDIRFRSQLSIAGVAHRKPSPAEIKQKIARFADRLTAFSALRIGALQVTLVVDLRQGLHLPHLLQSLRDRGIWTSSNLAPSAVRLVAVVVCGCGSSHRIRSLNDGGRSQSVISTTRSPEDA